MPSKRPERMQHVLKSASGTTGAQVIAPELLDQLFVAMHDAIAAPDMRFRRITLSSA
jgi:hypothetical protein